MSNDGDPFRGDREAAQARTDALEHEVDQLERERDELKAKLAAAEGTKRDDAKRARKEARKELERENAKTRRASSDSESSGEGSSKNGLLGGIFAIAATAIVGVVIAVPTCSRGRAHERWIAANDQYTRDTQRWDAYTAVGACLRATRAALARTAHVTAARMDPRHGTDDGRIDVSSTLLPDCTSDVAALAQDLMLPQQAREAAAAWSRAADDAKAANKPLAEYYQHADWKDDDYAAGAAKWEPWIAARKHVDAAVGIARDTLQQAVVKAVAAIESAQVDGSETWWKIEIGARLDAMANEAIDERPTEVAKLATQLLADVKGAPLEIRRAVRETSDLEQLAHTGTIYDASAGIDRANYRFWGSLQRDQAPFASPGNEPEGACDGGD